MNEIIECIVQINCLNYNKQCKYVKKKVSWRRWYKPCYKLHVIFYKIASYLAKLDNNIGDKDICLFNFWDELYDNKYFDDKIALIQIKYIKLTNNIYQIRVPVKNSQMAIISYINIS